MNAKQLCQFCGKDHTNWYDQCNEYAAALENAMRQQQADRRKAEEERLEAIRRDGTPVGYINEYRLKALLKNNGVLAKVPFDYPLSQEPNDVQTVPLFLAGPAAPRVDVPAEEGWYWLRMNGLLVIEHVIKRPGHEYLAIHAESLNGKRDFLAVAKMPRAQWWGPILPPEL